MSAGLHQRRQGPGASEIEPVDDAGDATERTPTRPGGSAAARPGRRWLGAPPCAASILAALLTALAIMALIRLLPPLLLDARAAPGGAQAFQLFTPEQLRRYDGRTSKKVYLAVLGQVYDVTAGARHYGPQGGYATFAGRDASRSFVTGKWDSDGHDDVAGLGGEQLRELVRWREFYERHKDYFLIGRVVGRFYDARGGPTPLLARVEEAAAAHLAAQAAGGGTQGQAAAQQQQGFPCNVKWSKAEGGAVWCPTGSYPRRVMQPDWQGQLQERCACMDSAEHGGAARLYDGCQPEAERCATSPPEA